MAITKQRALQAKGPVTVLAIGTEPMTVGTLVTYNQTTEAITVGANLTYNMVTVGNSFGPETSRKVAVEAFEPNKEYWVTLAGTVAKGDRLGSDAAGKAVKDATNVASLVAMSAGVAGQTIPAQKKI